jgi:hypothetical protein
MTDTLTVRGRQATFIVDVEHFRARLLQDCLTEATVVFWRRRAQTFEDAAPRPGDFTGQASKVDLARRAERCREIAAACRHHADVIESGQPEPISADVAALIREAA